MGLKDIHLKLKAFQLRNFLMREGKNRKRETELGKKPSWMVPAVSYGYHVVENLSYIRGESNDDEPDQSDSVVAQREQIEDLELWFFGVSDAHIGDGITKYMQSHLFDKKPPPKESQLKRKSKETMRKAYLWARDKTGGEVNKAEEDSKVGSASALVINGEKLLIADMGDYRAVVCRDGEAYQISPRHRQGKRWHWSRRFIPGIIRMPKIRIPACDSGSKAEAKTWKGSKISVGDERIDSDTEFVILASTGIWQVMKHHEAVNLIRHLEDPQEAAECLAKEALVRMSRSSISCLVIRFD